MTIFNIKERLVWCQHCKYEETTDKANPYCPNCNQPMITVLYSLERKERITK